ncbi:FkbM family methyltransferase [Rhizobium sp. TRM96647]|uniref:FkbM family methyltransferase n=1 Tax=unclassified Rhizobium TaxID=2613769 RepID=UPI0021E8586F|nr:MULTISPECIES: FkbM family methyltransferase [unclassified Rhizobium]MCV3736656.1 FkbM family methyltransferase [Rhizobium sp. TRM96647]MCV3759025.1 FkbM family methyltransferase [Rhizobium sp. TRM96650]
MGDGGMSVGGLSGFLKDIEPFFVGRPLIYVDVGANRGDTFGDLVRSGLNVNRAVLFEPNPKVFARLTESVAELGVGDKAVCHNIALSDQAGTVQLRDMDDMSKVLADKASSTGVLAERIFEIEAQPLDSFAANFPDGHVSLLKIDVEGHEAEVLRGASSMLAAQSVDLIYIEVGLNPHSGQQTYYRTIEDILLGQNYRLFKIYEQTHEWIENSPFLRRVNMAFMSQDFALRHPLNLVRELQNLRASKASELKKANDLKSAEIAVLQASQESELSAVTAERDRLGKELAALQSSSKSELSLLKQELADRFQEVAALTQLAEGKDVEIAALRAAHRNDVEMLRSENLRQGKEVGELAKRHNKEMADLEKRLNKEITSLKSNLEKKKAEYSQLKQDGNRISSEKSKRIAKLESERDKLVGKVEFLRNSFSWRLTVPLRKIGNAFRRSGNPRQKPPAQSK